MTAPRVVLTGGPGAGKTAVLELLRRTMCDRVHVLPESAGIVFGGGFPRGSSVAAKCAAQRAIFYVQRELEQTGLAADPVMVLCDRGTIDGLAYWPGEADFFESVGTTLDAQLARYHAVIHLRTPPADAYTHANPLRIESATEAQVIDARIARAWARHPRRFEIPATPDFIAKAAAAIAVVRAELPACCREHAFGMLGEHDAQRVTCRPCAASSSRAVRRWSSGTSDGFWTLSVSSMPFASPCASTCRPGRSSGQSSMFWVRPIIIHARWQRIASSRRSGGPASAVRYTTDPPSIGLPPTP